MKIALLCLGTRGDVQPYAVLGKALQERGHQVVLSTAKNFGSLVQSYGIDFLPVEADYQGLLNTEEGRQMMKNPLSAIRQLKSLIYPMMIQSLGAFYEISAQQDRVLFHTKTMAHQFAHCFPGRMMEANVVPAMEPTAEFVNPVLSAMHLPSFMNRFSYKFSTWGLNMWKNPVKAFQEKYRLSPAPTGRRLPSIYGISRHFLPQPADYPSSTQFTGFWTRPSGATLDQALTDFLAAGDPPLMITFGSMPFDSSLQLPDTIPALAQACSTRVLVVRGWGLQKDKTLQNTDEVFYTDGAPYDQLIPRVKAVIHHGGIGTLAACMRAGKPSWICPVLYPLGDQHFWTSQGVRNGVCLPPIALKKIKEDQFIAGARTLLERKELYDAAAAMQRKLEQEDGIGRAIEIIEA
jgi:sterol 3beta-glucosyltransferase